uniref:Uncharacterized protein n=1 Tax=Sphaeramia orbicularis TaxID=375764 RepID=A0A672YHB0_9TELE
MEEHTNSTQVFFTSTSYVDEKEELVTSTVLPEEIPPIPENQFLVRRSLQSVHKVKNKPPKDLRNKDERQREGIGLPSNFQSTNQRLVMTRSEKGSKSRDLRQYRTPSCSHSRSQDCFWCSETPPHRRQEMQRWRMRAITGEHWIKDDRELAHGKPVMITPGKKSSQ